MKLRWKTGKGLRIGKKTLLVGLAAAVVIVLPAVTISTQPEAGSADGATVVPSLLRLFAAFAAVIALVYLLSVALKRFNGRKQARGGSLMNVLEVLPLGAKAKLVAVKLGNRVFVIGAGESSVNNITELDEPEYSPFYGEQREGPVVSFRERFSRLARK